MTLLGWLWSATGAFVVGLGLLLLLYAVDSFRAAFLGVPGRVTVEDCTWRENSDDPAWKCSGPFVSDDGSIRIAVVAIDSPYADQPTLGDTVLARVADPTADTAYTEENWLVPGIAGLVMVVVGVWGVRRSLRARQPAAAVALFDLDTGVRVGRASASLAGATTAAPVTGPDETAGAGGDPRVTGTAGDAGAVDDTRVTGVAVDAGAAGALDVGADPAAGRVNRAIWRVLGAWSALAVTIAGLLWSLAEWEKEQDALLSVRVSGTVVADRLGSDRRIEVGFPDQHGEPRSVRLTPVEPSRFRIGDRVDLRYDPDLPDQALPVRADLFVLEPRERTIWVALLTTPGVLLAWAWVWRLGRWGLGALRRPVPAMATVRLGEFVTGTEPISVWLLLAEPTGEVRCQRIIWDRRFMERLTVLARGRPDLALPPLPVMLRRCPGLRRMYLVDLPGVGRLWPASTARRRPPRNYELLGFDPRMAGNSVSLALIYIAGVLLVAGVVGVVLGPFGAGYLVAVLASAGLWLGGAPWQGAYAFRPPPRGTPHRRR